MGLRSTSNSEFFHGTDMLCTGRANSIITHQAVHVHLFTLIRELITMAPAFTIGLWGLSGGKDNKIRYHVDEGFRTK